MRVSYSRLGGLVPKYEGCALDTKEMPPEEAKELEQLVAESGITTLEGRRIPGAGDVKTVTIAVESESGAMSVTFDLPALPDRARPLVAFLQRRSRDLLSEG